MSENILICDFQQKPAKICKNLQKTDFFAKKISRTGVPWALQKFPICITQLPNSFTKLPICFTKLPICYPKIAHLTSHSGPKFPILWISEWCKLLFFSNILFYWIIFFLCCWLLLLYNWKMKLSHCTTRKRIIKQGLGYNGKYVTVIIILNMLIILFYK